MIEIVALFFLCKKNAELAILKGLKPNTWKLYTVLAWILAEFIGVAVGMAMFGIKNLYPVLGIGLFSAFGGYLFIRALLEKMPNSLDEEVNKIGVDDLQPPKIK